MNQFIEKAVEIVNVDSINELITPVVTQQKR